MAQKNFFSLNGFSDAGTGDNSGSSLAWASQYDIKSAAAFDTWNETDTHTFATLTFSLQRESERRS